jgi:hypothetical protein
VILRSSTLEPIPTLFLCLRSIYMQLRASTPILIDNSAVLRSIAPLLRLNALVETATFVLLAIDHTNLHSSASLLAAPTDPRQYVFNFYFLFCLIISLSLIVLSTFF